MTRGKRKEKRGEKWIKTHGKCLRKKKRKMWKAKKEIEKISNEREKERNPHVHIQYAIQKPHNTAGQHLWPWQFWQKWFTMVTVGRQPSEHPRTLHHSPTFLAASLPIWLDAQLKCHASVTHMHTHQINQTETVGWKGNRARWTSQKWEKPETKVTHYEERGVLVELYMLIIITILFI